MRQRSSRFIWTFSTSCLVATVAVAGLFAFRAHAAEDPATLYDLSIEATPSLAKGASGNVKVSITPKGAGELHGDTPIKLELAGPKNVALSKEKLNRADVKTAAAVTIFDVPFTATDSGSGTIEAKLTFWICTDKLCAPQHRDVSLPVTVR